MDFDLGAAGLARRILQRKGAGVVGGYRSPVCVFEDAMQRNEKMKERKLRKAGKSSDQGPIAHIAKVSPRPGFRWGAFREDVVPLSFHKPTLNNAEPELVRWRIRCQFSFLFRYVCECKPVTVMARERTADSDSQLSELCRAALSPVNLALSLVPSWAVLSCSVCPCLFLCWF